MAELAEHHVENNNMKSSFRRHYHYYSPNWACIYKTSYHTTL